MRYQKTSWQFAALATTAAWMVYFAAFIPLHAAVEDGIAELTLLPVGLAAWMRGARPGVISALITIPVNLLLFAAVGEGGSGETVERFLNAAAFVIVAWALGHVSDARRKVVEASLHDPVTGLPNRVAFVQDVGRALKAGGATVVVIGLDGTTEVAETFGY